MTVNLKLLRLFLIHDVLPISRFLFNFRLGFFKHSTIFLCCTFIPLFPVREGWRAEGWRPTGLMKEVRLLQLGCSLASQGSREPQACCQIRLDTTSMLIMWLSVLWVFKLLIYLAKYTVISPFLSKGQLRHRPVIVSKQSRDLKPQYNLTSRRSFKKHTQQLFLPVLGFYYCTGAVPSCGEQRLLSGCGSWASHCGGFLRSSGSGVMTPGLSCSVACGEMFPDQTRGPCIGRQLLNNETTRKDPKAQLVTLLATVLTS